MRAPTLAKAGVVSFALLAVWVPASATPLDFLPVNDPLEDELRALELSGAGAVPHLGIRPLQVAEIPLFLSPDSLPPAARVAATRLLRALARDRAPDAGVRGATPRLLQRSYEGDQAVEASVGLEGAGHASRDRAPRLGSASGLQVRLGLRSRGWLAHSHLIAGYVEGGLRFAESLFEDGEAILHSEEAYVAHVGRHWAARAGRSRWHWGPGHEGSLLLSRTAGTMSGMTFHLRVEPLRADAVVLNAALGQAGGERLAAHRLEWEPRPGLRLGLAEAARYRSSSWEPLYVIGVLPYPLVQNLLVQDEPDSLAAHRNNVLAGIDVAWRPAPGTRIYAELLVDDLRTDASTAVNKLAYQLGLEGVGAIRGQRVTWGTEYTRLSRYVYTSFFGRSFVHQDRPLGFPTGPDARRLRVRATWDPSPEWQLLGAVARTDLGESGWEVPYVPGQGPADSWTFAGTVEETRELEIGLRWWPAAGVDLALLGGWRWQENEGHLAGARTDEPRGSLVLRLVR